MNNTNSQNEHLKDLLQINIFRAFCISERDYHMDNSVQQLIKLLETQAVRRNLKLIKWKNHENRSYGFRVELPHVRFTF